jgi:RNA 2',3'-cyclic 3'-phosphodiesterase
VSAEEGAGAGGEPTGRASHRLFIAVPIPDAAIEVIADLVAGVRRQVQGADSVRWVRLDGLHLTVRFLGQAPASTVRPLSAAVDAIAAARGPFEVSIAGGGSFPQPGRPRVLWLGLTDGADALAGLADALTSPLEALGWAPDTRPFRGHLTIARCDGVKAGAAVAKALQAAAQDLRLRFDARRLVLFESLTGRGPARYVPLHEAELAPPAATTTPVSPRTGDNIAAEDHPARAGRKGALGTT